MTDAVPACHLHGIVKRYPTGTLANDRVTFTAAAGEVHALVGENGAGKTTLMRILYGLEAPDAGTIHLWGQPVRLAGPRAAIRAGVGMVHQHFMLAPSLTVAENVVLGHEPGRWRVQRRLAERLVAEVGARHRLWVDPAARVADLSVGERQRVEVVKALYRGARLLILDEPTAVLTAQEAVELWAAARRLAAAGGTVIVITHRLGDVARVADRVSVMRRGRLVGTFDAGATDEARLARLMIGSTDIAEGAIGPGASAPGSPGPLVLEVEGLGVREAGRWRLAGLEMVVRAGEILGIAGVEGNGQRELVEVLAGMRPPAAGRVRVAGRDLTGAAPAVMRAAGVGMVPEDRLGVGLAGAATVAENLIVDRYRQRPFSRHGWLSWPAITGQARRLMAQFDVRAPGPAAVANTLSGGTMQRLVLARELSAEPRLLIAAQPTRGLDVAASAAIRARLRSARAAGTAIVLVSADLDDIDALADRVLVLAGGRVTATFERQTWVRLSDEQRGLYLSGSTGDRSA